MKHVIVHGNKWAHNWTMDDNDDDYGGSDDTTMILILTTGNVENKFKKVCRNDSSLRFGFKYKIIESTCFPLLCLISSNAIIIIMVQKEI